MESVYGILQETLWICELPGTKQIANAHLTHLKALARKASAGNPSEEKVAEIRETVQRSIGAAIASKSLELRNTIGLIRVLDGEIEEIEEEIQDF